MGVKMAQTAIRLSLRQNIYSRTVYCSSVHSADKFPIVLEKDTGLPLSKWTLCEFTNKRSYNVKRHVKLRHCNSRPEPQQVENYNCQHCLFTASRQDSLKRHLKKKYFPYQNLTVSNGSREQVLMCPQCPKTFIRQNNLDSHMLQKHEKEGNVFTCPHCHTKYIKKYLWTFTWRKNIVTRSIEK